MSNNDPYEKAALHTLMMLQQPANLYMLNGFREQIRSLSVLVDAYDIDLAKTSTEVNARLDDVVKDAIRGFLETIKSTDYFYTSEARDIAPPIAARLELMARGISNGVRNEKKAIQRLTDSGADGTGFQLG